MKLELQNVEALLFFLSDFFIAESIDPRTADGIPNVDAIVRIKHYPHYQGLFSTLTATIQNAAQCADRVNEKVEILFKTTRSALDHAKEVIA